MRKLIGKEVREQLPMAVLGLLVFTVLLAMSFAAAQEVARRAAFSSGYGSGDGLHPLLSGHAYTVVGFFCAIFGALLGFRQIFAERHPDLWAFLIHRPIEPMAILRSKAMAGVLLYLGAAGLPLLGFMLACSRAGAVAAPFEWAMVRPLAALWLTGLVFYEGGMLTALRKARWYVSKGCGLGLPLVVVLGAVGLPEFWQALLLIGVAIVIQGLAVWGSFRTGGFAVGQPALGKAALAVTAGVTAALVCGFVIVSVFEMVSSSWGIFSTQYHVTKDGLVVRVTHRGVRDVEITDLAGNRVLDPASGQPMDWNLFQSRNAPGIQTHLTFSHQLDRRLRSGYARAQRYFQPLQASDKVLWYLTAQGKIEGFDGLTRESVGELQPVSPAGGGGAGQAEPFLQQDLAYGGFRPGDMPVFLATARTVHRVDIRKREVQPLLELPADESILGTSRDVWFASETSNQVLIASRKFLRLIDQKGKLRFQIPYDPAPELFPSATVYPLMETGGYIVRFEPDHWQNLAARGQRLTHIKRVNPDSTVGDFFDLPKLPDPSSDHTERAIVTAAFPPALTLALNRFDPREPVWPRVMSAILFGLVGLGLARRDRSTTLATMGWTLFHLILGLPGLLAYLAVRECPVRESCPGCRRLRVVNREHCEHCGAPFAAPPRTGIEIFEPVHS